MSRTTVEAPAIHTRGCLSRYAVYRMSSVLTKSFIILDYAASAKLFSPIIVRLKMVEEYTIIPLHAYYTIIDPVDTSQPHMFWKGIVMAFYPAQMRRHFN